jgi:hypothetical protein
MQGIRFQIPGFFASVRGAPIQSGAIMAINGIESVLYGVDDVAECTRYFIDFGLPLVKKSPDSGDFKLPQTTPAAANAK